MTDDELTRLTLEQVLPPDHPWRRMHFTPSGSIEDVWILVEALHKEGWTFSILWTATGEAEVTFEHIDDSRLVISEASAVRSDPLRAIVIAALRAVGVEV